MFSIKYISKTTKIKDYLEEAMRTFHNLLFSISAILLLTVPSTGFCMNIKKETIPLIEMLQNGTAKVSSDKKNIIDDKGNFIAKETANTIQIKPKQSPANPTDSQKDNSTPTPLMFTCNKKCAIIAKHCYIDENENIVCINVCDKEALICE
jgi:hypothetical protein